MSMQWSNVIARLLGKSRAQVGKLNPCARLEVWTMGLDFRPKFIGTHRP